MSRTRPIYKNKYAGSCVLCGRTVPGGFGYTERSSDGTWSVFH